MYIHFMIHSYSPESSVLGDFNQNLIRKIQFEVAIGDLAGTYGVNYD